jgi:predicted transcriptional regulator
MTIHVSLELDEAQRAELERIARHEDITFDALMTRLAKQRLEYDAWFRAEVQKGIDSVARGEVLDHEEVFRGIEALLATRDSDAA